MFVELVTLGGLALEGTPFHRVKPLLLLTYVALEGRRDRRHLAELFWPQAADPLNSLAASLKQLKQHAPGAVQITTTHVASDIPCDARTFLQTSDAEDDKGALETYHGPFLEGVFLHGWSVELEEWVYSTREVLALRARRALLTASELQAKAGRFGAAAKYAEQAYLLPGASPMESGELRSVYTLLAAGNSPLVSRIKQHALEFGIAFSFSSEEARSRFQTAEDVTTKAKEHAPNNASAPTKESAAQASRLPLPLTSFVGRDLELAHMENLLLRLNCRLLTLTGTGGIGKTRLALQLAEKLRAEYADGIWYVPLEALHTVETIPQKLAEALNLLLSSTELPSEQVVRHLANKHMLLVLDNYEHLLDGALLVAELLQSCPKIQLLVTSRERLDLEGEWVLPLSGLLYPTELVSAQQALEYSAPNLLIDRIKRVNPGLPLTERELPLLLKLCQLVGGLPLALELAAVWLRAQSLEQLTLALGTSLDILQTTSRNISERHRSIRATFDGSWELLPPKKQDILGKLSVFRGGFRNEAAAYVAGASLADLVTFVDKSLLALQPDGRYAFHPLLQHYCREKLALQEDRGAYVYNRYQEFHLTLIFEIAALLHGPKHAKGLEFLQEEQDNIRDVLTIAEASVDVEVILQLANNLRTFRVSQGYFREDLADVMRQIKLFKRKEVNLPTLLLAEPPKVTGEMAEPPEEGKKVAGLDDDSPHLHQPAEGNGNAVSEQILEALEARAFGDYERAKELLRKCLRQHRLEHNRAPIHQHGLGLSLTRLGLLLCEQGFYDEAKALYEESLALHRALSDDHGIAITLLGMSDISREQQDSVSVFDLCTESLRIFQGMQELWGVGYSLNNLALGAYIEGDLGRAAALADECVTLNLSLSSQAAYAESLSTAGWIALAQGDFRQAHGAFRQSLSEGWEHLPRWLHAVILEGLAAVAVRERDFERAVQLFGVARILRQTIGVPLSPLRRSMTGPFEAEARSSLSLEAWSHADEMGQRLPLDPAALPLYAKENRYG